MLSPERQSARMSKITNDDLTRHDALQLYPSDNSGRQRVKNWSSKTSSLFVTTKERKRIFG